MVAPQKKAHHYERKDDRRRPGNDKVGQGQGQIVAFAKAVGVGRRGQRAEEQKKRPPG